MILDLNSDKVSALKQRSRNMGHKSSGMPVDRLEKMEQNIRELKEQMKQILIILKQKGIKPQSVLVRNK